MKTLVAEDQLREGIRRLASEIQKHYDGKPLTLVGVLMGSIVLLADLIRLAGSAVAGGVGAGPQLPPQGRLPGTAGDRRRLLSSASGPQRAAGGRYLSHRPHPLGT